MTEPIPAPIETGRPVRGSRAEGAQSFELPRTAQELKAVVALQNLDLERERTRHELAEVSKDNDQRRRRELIGFYVVVAIAVVGLTVGFAVAVLAQNDATQRWAQGLVTLLFGGIVGGLAGYFTGKVGK